MYNAEVYNEKFIATFYVFQKNKKSNITFNKILCDYNNLYDYASMIWNGYQKTRK